MTDLLTFVRKNNLICFWYLPVQLQFDMYVDLRPFVRPIHRFKTRIGSFWSTIGGRNATYTNSRLFDLYTFVRHSSDEPMDSRRSVRVRTFSFTKKSEARYLYLE